MPKLKVIARHTDGRIVKGTTNNFWPGAKVFHVTPLNGSPDEPPTPVSVDDLKAMFVVRSLDGDPEHIKRPRFLPGEGAIGQKLEITFQDGEVLEGAAMDYDRQAQGFFVAPADREGNNERVYIVNNAVRSIRNL